MASLDAAGSIAARRDPDRLSMRTTLQDWRAELAPFPNRWRRAARVAFVTALGAGVMAIFQISNPLGLTMILSFAAPEYAFSVATAVTFLMGAAAMQLLALATIGALVNAPVAHVIVFIAYTFVTTYLIYGVPRLGRIWIWVQIPTATAFYLVLFDHRGVGWDNAQMYAGLVVAVAMLWLFNSVIWPAPASDVLAGSLRGALERSRRRLRLLVKIFLAEDGAIPDHDRGVASKLAYHLSLLGPATGNAKNVREPAALLAKVIVAERIHNEIDRLCVPACSQLGSDLDESTAHQLREAEEALAAALEAYIAGDDSHEQVAELQTRLEVLRAAPTSGPGRIELEELAHHFEKIAALFVEHPDDLPRAPAESIHPIPKPAFHLNKFLIRFCARHSLAMTIAFVGGLYDNNAAIHAALWLLMIGSPPSHGATARKFTVRAIGAAGALSFAALATVALAPNFVSPPPYMLAIFVGALLMTYIGEGGGALSYLAIGGTAFVIAFSAPGPRPDMVGSIWSIWGISLGMIIRAIVSVIWREHTNRTLAEEFERPLAALIALTPRRDPATPRQIVTAEMEIVAGVQEMLSVATDAQLQGRSTGIDARELVDSLDTTRRLAFALGNLSLEERASSELDFDEAIRARLESWLVNLRAQLEPGRLEIAPLRTMASSTTMPDVPAAEDPARQHIAGLRHTLEVQLKTISLH
jgi:hypothetical protein